MRVHWFAFTFFGERQEFDAFYDEFLSPTFGKYIETEHGGRGYKMIATANCGVRLYFNPVSVGDKGTHCHVEIPGEACECLIPDTFRLMMMYLVYSRFFNGVPHPELFSVKRLDLAFDHKFFTPMQWYEAIQGPDIVTLAKRDNIRLDQSPNAQREDGQIGTTSVYLGSMQSERLIRVYDKRGPTRVEFQLRDDRAHMVAIDVLVMNPTKWHEKALGHLIQFVTFRENEAPQWWSDFTQSVQSADLIISSSRVVSLRKLDKWFKTQVGVALSVVYEVEGGQYFKGLIKDAKKKDRTKYQSILELAGDEEKDGDR